MNSRRVEKEQEVGLATWQPVAWCLCGYPPVRCFLEGLWVADRENLRGVRFIEAEASVLRAKRRGRVSHWEESPSACYSNRMGESRIL